MKAQLPTIDYLRTQIELRDGVLYRIASGSGRKVGPIRGVNGVGYIQLMVGRTPLLGHRVAWALHHGSWPVNRIDHINGVKTDNRPENLRECTHSQNFANSGKTKRNTSGFKGVSMEGPRKFRARIRKDGVTYQLGYYDHAEDAAFAYSEACIRLYGEFAYQGLPA